MKNGRKPNWSESDLHQYIWDYHVDKHGKMNITQVQLAAELGVINTNLSRDFRKLIKSGRMTNVAKKFYFKDPMIFGFEHRMDRTWV